MPRYIPNSRFSDCWSSIGNISFYHKQGQCYWRTRPCPAFPGTPAQQQHMQIHRRALAAWKTLPSQVQWQWNSHAKSVPSHRPPYGQTHHITGHNLFVSAYHGFAQLGNEHIPMPQPYPMFPITALTSVSATVINGTDLQLDCTIQIDNSSDPQRFRLTSRIQLTRPSGGANQSLMRSFLSVTRAWAPKDAGYQLTVRFLIPDYRSVWGLDLQQYSVHMRGRLIDSVTGYRDVIIKGKHFISL